MIIEEKEYVIERLRDMERRKVRTSGMKPVLGECELSVKRRKM